MCGIVGYVGGREACPILLKGLHRLEYRGYDSAGVAMVDEDGALNVYKCKGKVSDLEHFLAGKELGGNIGIAHTRWATHGVPNDVNAHPHCSESENIALIHNGIIENYRVLKDALEENGYTFRSSTDSEVLVNLIEYIRSTNACSLLEAVQQALRQVVGAYAIAVVEKNNRDEIIAARQSSPMAIGIGRGEYFLSSDAASIIEYTQDFVYVNDGEIAVINRNKPLKIVTLDNHEGKIDIKKLQMSISQLEKGGYPHFMLKEIYDQPKALRDTINPRIRDGRVVLDDVKLDEGYLRGLRRIYMVACGSASYVGNHAKYILERTTRIQVEPVLASEFRYSEPVLGDDTLVIIISQSGETADTLAALREANARGARTLAIVNVVGSAISKAAHDVIYTCAGPEIAVATTKAYSTQLAVIYLLAMYIGEKLGTLAPECYAAMLEGLQRLPDQVAQILVPENLAKIEEAAEAFSHNHDVFFIGRNLDSATCLEGSLKLKEIAYVHSEAYPAGELKHGPISLIEEETLVVALATVEKLFDKTMANVREVKARGAHVLGVTTEDFAGEIEKYVDRSLIVPKTHPLLQPSLTVIPLQAFAYYIALARGCDVDMPRNLAKSVTVE